MQKKFYYSYSRFRGAEGTTVNVTAAANTGSNRNTTINITGGGITKTVEIRQTGDMLSGCCL